jgi:hypothetical protein
MTVLARTFGQGVSGRGRLNTSTWFVKFCMDVVPLRPPECFVHAGALLHQQPSLQWTATFDTCTAVADLIDTQADLPTSPPSLYVDVEGVHLSRHGSISILQFFVSPDNRTYLIDIHTLGDKAFSTARATSQTLKGILESDSIPKVFDVRCDSDTSTDTQKGSDTRRALTPRRPLTPERR